MKLHYPKRKFVGLLLLLFPFSTASADELPDLPLWMCHKSQVEPLKTQLVSFHYEQSYGRFEHSSKPWAESRYSSAGMIWCSASTLLQLDSIRRRKETFGGVLLLRNEKVTEKSHRSERWLSGQGKDYREEMIDMAKYNPALLIQYFVDHRKSLKHSSTETTTSYTLTIDDTKVSLLVSKVKKNLIEVSFLQADDLYGDVETVISYTDYKSIQDWTYASTVKISKINGKIRDEIKIITPQMGLMALPKVDIDSTSSPLGGPKSMPTATIENYNDHINFVVLNHADERVMVVEFATFLMVMEAPFSPENGELIIQKAKEIAPNKPIKYFSFGHYHPHYLGGVRAFAHKGAEILCTPDDKDYVQYLLDAPRTLKPDSLAIEPRGKTITTFTDSIVISDGNFEVILYHIGEQSMHTYDYVLYYFPAERMVFEGDLVWIPKNKEAGKAGGRQKGLYQAMVDRNLDVETIIQSWPVHQYDVKTNFTFEELKATVDEQQERD